MQEIEAEVRGYITRGVESVRMDADGSIIFTMTDGDEVNVGSVGASPKKTLVWQNEPDTATVNSNVAALSAITQNPEAYDVRIKIGAVTVPALTVGGKSVIGISLMDGASMRAYQFTGTKVSEYRQATWTFINTGAFDEMSENGASQMSIAEYIDERLSEVTA